MAQQPPLIRSATLRDCAVLAALTTELGYSVPAGEAYAEVLAQVIARDEHRLLVAEHRGAVVGYVQAVLQPRLGLAGAAVTIAELVVTAKARGTGVGSAFLDAVVDWARQVGAVRLQLTTARSLDSYQRGFYRRRGFCEVDSVVLRAIDVARPGVIS